MAGASGSSSTSTTRADPERGASVIRNAVIHVINEQPLLADLFDVPSAADQALVCTNLRTMNGKRPIFADHLESIFVFPYTHIRFVEIPPGATGAPEVPASTSAGAPPPPPPPPAPEPQQEAELEIDEDFLRRIREV
jgi:hypothetical protein